MRRYTAQIARVIHLREVDIGRKLSELASPLLYPELHADVKETLHTLAKVIQGVVITFVDITVAKELEARLRKAKSRAPSPPSRRSPCPTWPATASNALALLHELQVHPVEIDLQAQELQDSRAELESALRRQIELYDHQPVGRFTIDDRLALHELDQTGTAMLGLDRDDAYGLPLDAFFGADSGRRFREALRSPPTRPARSSFLLRLCPKHGPERPVPVSIGADPAAQRYLGKRTDAADG